MKNIDRIRAMSTEKLAEWLDECGAEPLDFCETCNLDIKCEDCPDEDWKQIWMKWLEREIGEKREDAAVAAGDTISRQAALDIFDDYNVAVENGQIEAYSRDRKRLCNLPPAQQNLSEEYAKAVRNWLVNYQIKCAELKGRYTPYEVLGWIVSDWRKENGIW